MVQDYKITLTTRRSTRSLLALTAATLIALFGSGCTTVEPLTGRRQLILTSAQTEAQLGMQAWNEIKKAEKPTTNPAYAKAVERVGRNIANVVHQPGFTWEFQTFASDTANAFCLPGGKVAVYDGLFKYLDNDAELATVIAHEVAHAVARHGGERMTQAMLVELGGIALSETLNDEEELRKERWMLAYTGLTTFGYKLPYSRTHEYSADELGLIYMARAGYDPNAALSFWEKFAGDKNSSRTIEFLSTHPLGKNRIERLQNLMPRAEREYQNSPHPKGLGTEWD